MQQHMHYQVELAGTAATLYIAGQLGPDDVVRITRACRALPGHFRTLRVDMRAVGTLSADALGAVRTILHDWRERRQGEYRLRTSYLMVTCAEIGAASPRDDVAAESGSVSARASHAVSHGPGSFTSSALSCPW